jgi:hypothetical protein
VIFDLLYGWLMINGFLIVYGLGMTAKLAVLRSVDIGGIVFGMIYIIGCIVLTFKLFTKKKEV